MIPAGTSNKLDVQNKWEENDASGIVVVVAFTLKAVPVSTQYFLGPTDADAFRGHRLTTQKGYTYQK